MSPLDIDLPQLNTTKRAVKELESAKQELAKENYHRAKAHCDIVLSYAPQSEEAQLIKLRVLAGLGEWQDVMVISR